MRKARTRFVTSGRPGSCGGGCSCQAPAAFNNAPLNSVPAAADKVRRPRAKSAPPARRRRTRILAKLLLPGRGEPIDDAVVIIDDAKIDFAGPRSEAPIASPDNPEDEFEVPVLMPGMWDCHVHFFGNDAWKDFQDPITRGAKSVEHLAKALDAGFTSVREVGGIGYALAGLVEAGQLRGPNIYFAGDVLSITAGHGDRHELPLECLSKSGWPGQLCDGVPECIKAVRAQLRKGAHLIKICASGGVMSKLDDPIHQQFNDEELRAMVEEARRAERVVAAHCHGNVGIAAALRAGCHTIEHGSYLDDQTAAMMRDRGAILVPTRWAVDALNRSIEMRGGQGLQPWQVRKASEIHDSHLEAMRCAVRAGVKIALGTDLPGAAWGRNAEEAACLEQAGLTPLQVIEAATANGPETLGPQAPKSGQLRKGYDADMIALASNPLRDLRVLANPGNVQMVWKSGQILKPMDLAYKGLTGKGGRAWAMWSKY